MAIFGYERVSTVEQAEDGHSLETQRRMIEGQATILGQPVDRYFTDRAVSGGRPLEKRPQGQVMLETLERGDTVIATKLDRVFRSASNAIQMLEQFKNRDVSLILLDLGGDVTGNGVSQMVFTIMSAVAQFERERIAERISEVKETQRRNGRYLGGIIPFGWRITDDGDLVEEPAQQGAVGRMAEMRGHGKSLRAISDALKVEGIDISHAGVARVLKARGHSLGEEEFAMPIFKTQRAAMRHFVKTLGYDKERVCKAYAQAERRGEVARAKDKKEMSPEDYAEALWKDGHREDRKAPPWLEAGE
jgi:putative DNA-invertase from lambdoid prophage Rac